MVPLGDALLQPRQFGQHQPDPQRRNGCRANAGAALACQRPRRPSSTVPGTANGIILMVATMSFGADHRVDRAAWRRSAPRRCALSRSIVAGVDAQQPGGFGVQVDAPGARRAGGEHRAQRGAAPAARRRSSSGTSPGSSLAAITSVRPAARRAAIAASSSTVPLRIIRSPAGAGCAPARRPAPRRAGMAPKDHAAAWAAGSRWPSGEPRRTATISAMIDSAISGAVTASMFSPTGPRMRAMRRVVVAELAQPLAAAPRGCAGGRARRCRTPGVSARGPAPGRPASGRASASRRRCATSGLQRVHRLVRPVGGDGDVGETLVGGEGAARIDHDDGEARAAAAIGTSAWAICTAPTTISRSGGL